MPNAAKRFRVHDESLNCYGFWVKTDGGDLSAFLDNPICLWNHSRGWRGTEEEILPIGIWKDLKVENGEITATPEFDMDDTFAVKIAKKVEKNHLRAASIGIQILAVSEAPEDLKPGQTRPTVTKWVKKEISICDIPANSNALVLALYDADGNQIELSDKTSEAALSAAGLGLINHSQPHQQMENLKLLAAMLALPITANATDVEAAITKLKNDLGDSKAETVRLSAELKKFQDQSKTAREAETKTLLDAAQADNRITAANRENFQKLFDADFENAKAILQGMTPVVKLSDFAGKQADGTGDGIVRFNGKTFSELSRADDGSLERLRGSNLELFKQMYRSEFGKDYKQ